VFLVKILVAKVIQLVRNLAHLEKKENYLKIKDEIFESFPQMLELRPTF
jgi:hypothetical protein